MSLFDRSRRRATLAALPALLAGLLAPGRAAAQEEPYVCHMPGQTLHVIDPWDLNPLVLRWSHRDAKLVANPPIKNYVYMPLTLVVGETAFHTAPFTNYLSVGGGGQEIAGYATAYPMGIAVNTDALRDANGEPRNGTYQATVKYWSYSQWGRVTKCLMVNVNVSFPRIVTASEIQFSTQTTSPIGVGKELVIYNDSYEWMYNSRAEVTQGSSWLHVGEAEPATIKWNSSRKISVVANPRGLAPGTYEGKIRVRADDAHDRIVTVKLTVQGPPPAIGFTESSTLLSMQVNAIAARTGTVGVRETHGGTYPGLTAPTITYTGARSGWLTGALYYIHGETGNQVPQTTTPAQLNLRSVARGLPAGVYTATVTVGAPGAAPGQLPVTLEVVNLALCQAALTDPSQLPEAERLRLDALGNKDGVYNLGDYQALRTRLGLQ